VALALADRMLVLDIDADANGASPDTVLAALQGEELVTDTLTIRTPSGGLHLYFTAEPKVVRMIPQRVRVMDQVDVRLGGKGYVLVPPSPGYRIECDREPAPAPSALIERLLTRRRDVVRMPGTSELVAATCNDELAVPEEAVSEKSGLLEGLPPSLRRRTIEQMLEKLPRPDVGVGRYELWRDMAFALLDAVRCRLLDKQPAFELWRDWSLTGKGADSEDELRRRWETFARGDAQREGERIGFGTLVHMAREHGWQEPRFDAVDYALADAADGQPPRWPPRGKGSNSYYATMYALARRSFLPRYDTFTGRFELDGRSVSLDELLRDGRALIAAEGWSPAEQHVRAACEGIAHKRQFDSARDRLDRLRWDGEQRLDTWLGRVVGTGDPYVNAVGRLLVCGIVARQYAPGCKFDVVPVLVGPQGVGKSTLARLLALDDDWFTEMRLGLDDRQIYETTRGKLVVELAELAGHSRAEIEQVKQMLTRQRLRVRPAYARDVHEVPVRHVYVITTNDSFWARDRTGGRRFFPVKCKHQLDLPWLRENVEQILAEAVVRVQQALIHDELADLLTPSDRVLRMAGQLYEQALPPDVVEDLLSEWFDDLDGDLLVPCEPLREAIRLRLDWKSDRGLEKVIADGMQQRGFERCRLRRNGQRSYFYVRGDAGIARLWQPPLDLNVALRP